MTVAPLGVDDLPVSIADLLAVLIDDQPARFLKRRRLEESYLVVRVEPVGNGAQQRLTRLRFNRREEAQDASISLLFEVAVNRKTAEKKLEASLSVGYMERAVLTDSPRRPRSP